MSTLFGIHFYQGQRKSFINLLEQHLNKEEKRFIVTANPEIMMQTCYDPDYKAAVSSAHYVVADGIGVVKAMRLMNNAISERVTGIEIMMDLLEIANNKKLSVYFLGASEISIERMMSKIQDSYPGLHVSGYHHGFFVNSDLINEEIQTQKPDLVFVAMGAPQQEVWIANNLHQFEKGIFIGVGGSFDVLSGEQKRSPQYLQNIHLEWLFRIMNRPHKLKKFRTLAMFSILIFRNYLTMLWDKDIGIEEIE